MQPETPAHFWDERFRPDRYFYGEAPNRFLEAHAHLFPAKGSLLGLGEGEGRNGVFLAERGFQVTALDLSSVGLEKAQRLAARRGTTLTPWQSDLEGADLGNEQWDGIYNIFCHLPSDVRQRLHPRIRQALKPGGVFLTQQFSPRQLAHASGGPPQTDLLPDLPEFLDDFAGWEVAVARAETITLDEGLRHQGPAAVVSVIVKKPREALP